MRDEYGRDETKATTKLTYLLIGGGIGAVLALLFAPKSGEELRGDIADVTRKGLEKSKEAAAQIQEKAGEYYEVSREKAGELYQTAAEKAGEFTEKARSAAARSRSAAPRRHPGPRSRSDRCCTRRHSASPASSASP